MISTLSMSHMNSLLTILIGASLIISSCGDGSRTDDTADSTSGDAAANSNAASGPSCTIAADLEIQSTPPKSFKAVGSITCTAPATLQIEVCAQLDGADAQCESTTSSGVATLAKDVAIACIGTKALRARVNASVNGDPAEETLSDEVRIQCQ